MSFSTLMTALLVV